MTGSRTTRGARRKDLTRTDLPRASLRLLLWGLVVGTTLTLSFARATAGNVTIQSDLDKDEIAIGEVAVLTVTVTADGVDLPQFQLPPIQGLQVSALGETQGMSWVNGRVTRTKTASYALRGITTGTFEIPKIAVQVGGRRTESLPHLLQVRRAPPAVHGVSGDIVARLTLDRTSVVWNEGILARFTLYSRGRIEGAPVWDPPDAPGFWAEVLGPARTGRVRAGGVEYDAAELRVEYFPTRPGRLRIGPGRVHVQVVHRTEPPDPWSALGLPETRVEEVVLETERAAVDVRSLPGGAPDAFHGAVGSFALAVGVDRAAARVGEPITVTTTIRGEGNLSSAGDPDVRALGAARQYAGTAATSLDRSGARLRGERRRQITFVPETPGAFTVLPVRFAWYDPEEGRFRTQTSDTIRVKVLPASRVGDSLEATGAIGPLATLRHGRGRSGTLTLDPPAAAGAIALASLLAYGGTLLLVRLRDRAERDPRRRRFRELELLARRVPSAGAVEVPPGRSAALAAETLWKALELRYEVDLEGTPRDQGLARLRERGVREADVERLARVLSDLEQAAYAPPETAGGQRLDALRAAEELIRRYREELR